MNGASCREELLISFIHAY